MPSSLGRFAALLLLCVGIALPLLRSGEPPSTKQAPPTKSNGSDKKSVPGPMPSADSKKPIDLKKMDLSALPSEAVLVICERAGEALQMVPNAVILSPGKYQAMLDEIERLKKQLQSDKPVTPTRCDLRGRVEGAAVRLEAVFSGMTDRADVFVGLACPQAGAASAQTDGRVALIRRADSGNFVVRIEKAGEYHVKLELVLPLATREGSGRGFELTLPRAAITNLEMDLPTNVKDVRVGGKALNDSELAGLTIKNQRLSGNPGLGPVEKLDVDWKEIRPASGTPLRTVEGRVQVRLDTVGLTTETELLLKVEGAPAKDWQLLVPLGAEVKVSEADAARVKKDNGKVDQRFASLRTISLKEPSTAPLRVQISVRSPLPNNGAVVPVGPFFVLGAARQTGSIVIRNTVRDLQLNYRTRGDTYRPQTDETGGESVATTASFVYGNIPLVEKPREATGSQSLSWLDLEAETVRVHARTRVSHTLILRAPPATDAEPRTDKRESALRWEILTTITPTTKWTDGEPFKVFVPPQWNSTEENVAVVPESSPPFVSFAVSHLRDAPLQPIRLSGRYVAIQKDKGRILLGLPRPQGTVEQCEIKIEVPRSCEVALHNPELADLELLKQTRPNEQTWRGRLLPPEWPGIDVSWRPYKPELSVLSVADVTLHGNRGAVRQELRVQFPAAPPVSLRLSVPASADDVRLDSGASDVGKSLTATDGVISLPVPANAGGTEWRIVFHYTLRLGDKEPRPGEPFSVSLLVPEQATGGDSKVRLWSEPGSLPRLIANPNWEERNVEEVKDRPALPVLVAHSSRLDVSLPLRAGEQPAGASVLVERSLLRVRLLENGGQIWHARFLLRQLAGSDLDVILPGPVPTVGALFFLNHRTVTPDVFNEDGLHVDSGNVARLRLAPELIRQAALLEVFLQTQPGRTASSPLHSTLKPPRLKAAPATVPCRWLVSLPSHRVLLAPESAAGMERAWTRHGWLPAARLQRGIAELEHDFEASLPTELRQDSPSQTNDPTENGEMQAAPDLVCWQDPSASLTLTHAPQQGWLLVCSLGLLALVMGTYGAARPQPGANGRMASWFWPLLATATMTAALSTLFWPTTLWAIAYGCEPGAIVLLGVGIVQWLMHQRYRRQIVFLPSFSRSRGGSSLIRKNAAARPKHGEPSTVDAPPPAGAS